MENMLKSIGNSPKLVELADFSEDSHKDQEGRGGASPTQLAWTCRGYLVRAVVFVDLIKYFLHSLRKSNRYFLVSLMHGCRFL